MDFIDRKGAARILRVSVSTIYRLIKHGGNGRAPLPARKVGHSVRISVPELQAWIASLPSSTTPRRGRPKGTTKQLMKQRRAAEAAARSAS